MVLLKDDSADSGGNLELIEGLATTNIWRYFGNDDEDHLYSLNVTDEMYLSLIDKSFDLIFKL